MDPNATDLGNVTLVSAVAGDNTNLIIFGAISALLVCCIPLFIGENGSIHSRNWFISRA